MRGNLFQYKRVILMGLDSKRFHPKSTQLTDVRVVWCTDRYEFFGFKCDSLILLHLFFEILYKNYHMYLFIKFCYTLKHCLI